LCHQPALAGSSAIEVGLDIGFGQGKTRWAAIDDAAHAAAVALAECRDTKDASKGACHVGQDSQW